MTKPVAFPGFRRKNGGMGVRNHLLILPAVQYANHAARQIAALLPGSVTLENAYGDAQMGSDAAQTRRTLAGFAAHPNVGACLVLGLDGGQSGGDYLAEAAARAGTPVDYVNLSRFASPAEAVTRAVRLGSAMGRELARQGREICGIDELILGLECGGSDSWSGLSANPVTGECSDLVIEHGGTAMLSETQEMIGAEAFFAARAKDPTLRERFLQIVALREQESIDGGVDISSVNPSPGNKEGGLTTLEEKSLGCMQKGGTRAPLADVVEYAERPSKRGLVFMDTPGDDVESITGMVAGGSQVCVFTTGRGTCVGCPVAPVIKVASNTPMFMRMRDNMDFDAGDVVLGNVTIENAGQDLFALLLRVCGGEATKSEILGCDGNFSVTRTGITL